MNAQDLLDDIQGFSRETSNGLVVDDKNSDGVAAIDLLQKLGLGEIVVKGAELRELAEESCNVEGRGGGEKEDDESEGEEGRGFGIHVRYKFIGIPILLIMYQI